MNIKVFDGLTAESATKLIASLFNYGDQSSFDEILEAVRDAAGHVDFVARDVTDPLQPNRR
ncbi:hypothetical protein W59_01214 [Rhodococcus opacus RKJ300 = JCM 13270]|uniref:Uncharacterized protein n=1 Tax=Rhodococcus opacus RKJ300 = JCM 13270 TaxID=1165867 RepID=I0WZD1_RHOOP|nr:hypothetical protein W59_01214 [Rhodococcus opacus RKJ300 = JCM 13270]